MKFLRTISILLLIAFIAIQFSRPKKNNGGYEGIVLFENETKPSKKVSIILEKSCYDCHSNHTQCPWYAEVAPFSLCLADHIEHGKEHFNVSDSKNYSASKKEHKPEELVEMLESEDMPLRSYTIVHGNLSDEERKLLLQ